MVLIKLLKLSQLQAVLRQEIGGGGATKFSTNSSLQADSKPLSTFFSPYVITTYGSRTVFTWLSPHLASFIELIIYKIQIYLMCLSLLSSAKSYIICKLPTFREPLQLEMPHGDNQEVPRLIPSHHLMYSYYYFIQRFSQTGLSPPSWTFVMGTYKILF